MVRTHLVQNSANAVVVSLSDDSKMAAMGDEENDEEGVSTLAEYMERVEEQELEADLVLGGDDGQECTYKQGYMKRQAVFSCLNCTPCEEAGFFTACSFACHDGHDVVTLGTRRHFRCDCGNSKYGYSGICNLQPDKDIENSENMYNLNHIGVYCTCHCVYPDPGAALGELLQCFICEDWFHELHLGLRLLFRDKEGDPIFDELLCNSCVSRCPFLSKYPDGVIALATVPDALTDPVEIVEQTNGSSVRRQQFSRVENDKPSPLKPATHPKAESTDENGIVDVHQVNSAVFEVSNEDKEECEVKQEVQLTKCSTCHETVSNENATNGYHCELEKEVPAAIIQPGQPLFLMKSWRAQLCRCSNCLRMYEERGVGFLLDSDDTLRQAYEASAKRKREETCAKVDGSNLMKGLGHV